MKTLITAILIAAFTLTSSITLAEEAQTKKASYGFVMRATKATINKTDTGYELILKNVDPYTVYFSDRPARKAGTVKTSTFMKDWASTNSTMNITPPNTVIVFEPKNPSEQFKTQGLAVELIKPQILSQNSWKFTIKALSGEIIPGEYNETNLFVDNCFDSGCGGWCQY